VVLSHLVLPECGQLLRGSLLAVGSWVNRQPCARRFPWWGDRRALWFVEIHRL